MMDNYVTFIADFLLVTVGGFFGFVGALWSTNIIQNKEQKQRYKKDKSNMINELRENMELMGVINEREAQIGEIRFFFSPYLDFCWKSLIHTDNINLFSEDKDFSVIIYAYRLIDELNELEKLKQAIFLQHGKSVQLTNTQRILYDKRKDYISYIKKTIEAL